MNSRVGRQDGRQVFWAVAGIVAAILTGVFFRGGEISFSTGLTIWCLDLVMVVMISSASTGARLAAFLAGLCMAVPCFNQQVALVRFTLMCLMAVPLIVAVGLVMIPPIGDARARVAYVCSWFGTLELRRQPARFDGRMFLNLAMSTGILAGCIFVVKSVPASDGGLLLRWLGGGIAVLAFAEMITMAFPLAAMIAGVTAPPFFRSPYRRGPIGEFWARRWNVVVSEMLWKLCFEPLARRSVALGLVAAFGASAIAHALMALMALGSWKMFLMWGAFFLIQPLFIGVERWANIRRWPMAARRVWTLGILAITVPLFIEPMLQLMKDAWGGREEVFGPTFVALCTVMMLSGGFVAASRFSFTKKS